VTKEAAIARPSIAEVNHSTNEHDLVDANVQCKYARILDVGVHMSMAAHGSKMDRMEVPNSRSDLLEEAKIRRSRSDRNRENELAGIITSVIQIPREHHSLGNVSMCALLANSGYLDSPEEVTEADIYEALLGHPECIREWKQLSEDKRTTGWYLKDSSNGSYGIGYIPVDGEANIEPLEYPDEACACAAFVKRELENIRITTLRFETRHKKRPGRKS
jgi:hypothetical protein